MWRWRETFFTLITIVRKKFKDKAIVFTSASLLNYIIQCNLHVSTIKCICEQSDPITTKGTYACFDYNKEIKEQTTVPISRENKYSFTNTVLQFYSSPRKKEKINTVLQKEI